MKTIKPYTQIIDEINGQEILKKIEQCGRVCYKSEDKITDDSAEKFVAGLIKRGHEAMLEHASFIFEVDALFYAEALEIINELESSGELASFLRFTNNSTPIISGNVRAWRSFFKGLVKVNGCLPCGSKKIIENNSALFPEFLNVKCLDGNNLKPLSVYDLQTDNEKLTHWDVTVKFVVDRGVSHEIVRHRLASFAQESTRYCNYAKDDFGGEITFIEPFFWNDSSQYNTWKSSVENAEIDYFHLLNCGATPQEARAVLPNSLKTELVMSANLREWRHFFKLRAANVTGKAHPQMLEVTRPLLDELKTLIPVVFDDITYE